MTRQIPILGVLIVAMLPLASGCGHIDPKKLDASIRGELSSKGVALKSLDCPADRPLKKGDTFDCTGVDDDGETLVFHVTQTDGGGDITWKMDGMIINKGKVGDSIEAKLGEAADVQCPEKSVILQIGHSFTCDALVAGKKHQVLLTLADETGNVKWKILD